MTDEEREYLALFGFMLAILAYIALVVWLF